MAGRILFVSNDVFFWARVSGMARSIGRDAVRIGDDAAMEKALLEGGVARVIVDLGSPGVDPLAWATRWKGASPATQLVAFGSHVDESGLAAAREAGYDHVMPNSAFNRRLIEWLAE